MIMFELLTEKEVGGAVMQDYIIGCSTDTVAQ